MQITSLNSYHTNNVSQKSSENLNFNDVLEEIKNDNMENMSDVLDYVYDKANSAITKEEQDKYSSIGFNMFAAIWTQSMRKAMEEQGIQNPQQGIDSQILQKNKNEVYYSELRFKDYLRNGIEILEDDSTIMQGSEDRRTHAEFKQSMQASADLLKDILAMI